MARAAKHRGAPLTYKESGVDIGAGDEFAARIQRLLRQTYGPNVIENPGGFAGLLELRTDNLFSRKAPRPVLVSSTDGVGTKLKIAFMMDKHDTVGIDLVAMSVNDLICLGAQPLFFLDYMATGKLRRDVLLQVVKGIADGCSQAGCPLLGGETAEMPGFYGPGEYDLAGFAVGLLDRRRWINGTRVVPGDKLIGIASSGIHSNGYSLVRKLFFERAEWAIDRHVDEFGCTLGEELLRPTRIYAVAVRKVLSHYRVKRMVRGIAHITGGGLPGNTPRALPPRCGGRIVRGTWPVPPVFSVIQELGKIDDEEMYRVFNMGIGMVLVVSPFVVDAVLRRLKKAGEAGYLIGEVTEGEHTITIE
jgi:phosphoribosylformylglycinamidine cyclo-ligase